MTNTTTSRRIRLAALKVITVAIGFTALAQGHADAEAPAVVNDNASIGSTADVEGMRAAALLPDTDLTPFQVQEVLYAADRVCEGLAHDVPMVDMTYTLAQGQGLTDTEARDFVTRVAQVHCTR